MISYTIMTVCNCAATLLHVRAWRRRRAYRSWLASLEMSRQDLLSVERLVISIRSGEEESGTDTGQT